MKISKSRNLKCINKDWLWSLDERNPQQDSCEELEIIWRYAEHLKPKWPKENQAWFLFMKW